MNTPSRVAHAVFFIPGFDSPFCAVASNRGLVSLDLSHADMPPCHAQAPVRSTPEAGGHLAAVKMFLRAYFSGHTSPPSVAVDTSGWTAFQMDIYSTLMQVPYGEVITYGTLALCAGHPGKARATGGAMKRNRCPIVIPCHRVIAAGRGLGGWSGPEGFKERLLQHERPTWPAIQTGAEVHRRA